MGNKLAWRSVRWGPSNLPKKYPSRKGMLDTRLICGVETGVAWDTQGARIM
jgi:hypothetical protein